MGRHWRGDPAEEGNVKISLPIGKLFTLGTQVYAGLKLVKSGVPQVVRGIRIDGKIYQVTIAIEGTEPDTVDRADVLAMLESATAVRLAEVRRSAIAASHGDMDIFDAAIYTGMEQLLDNLKRRVAEL
jgi:hypothetical protein